MSYDPPFYMLAKFGREKHLRAFLERGQLYMNPVSYFWNLEGDVVRQDWLEGADNLIDPAEFAANFPINIDGTSYRLDRNVIAGPVKVTWAVTASTNLFCMYAFVFPPPDPLVDRRNLAFGDSFVLIKKPAVFLNRVTRAIQSKGFSCKVGAVEYVEPRVGEATPLNIFKKTRDFAYQSEFRIAAFRVSESVSHADTPMLLEIGSLEDISFDLQPLEQINSLIKVGPAKPD
jgi:hypothetical protein